MTKKEFMKNIAYPSFKSSPLTSSWEERQK